MVQEAHREADLSAQQPAPRQAPRIPSSHVDAGGPVGAARPAVEGSPAALGLIWRIRDRQSFRSLHASRHRARVGAIMVSWVAPRVAGEPPRIAFAVPRRGGSAVERNQVRRRLRALCAEMTAQGRLPGGSYLIGVTGRLSSLTFDQLRGDLGASIDKLVVTQSVGSA